MGSQPNCQPSQEGSKLCHLACTYFLHAWRWLIPTHPEEQIEGVEQAAQALHRVLPGHGEPPAAERPILSPHPPTRGEAASHLQEKGEKSTAVRRRPSTGSRRGSGPGTPRCAAGLRAALAAPTPPASEDLAGGRSLAPGCQGWRRPRGEAAKVPAANVSMLPLSSPSQRLVHIKRQKKRTRNDMFSELMQSSRTERAQQNAWRQTMAESRKVLNEHDERREEHTERRQDAMLRLMGEQADMFKRLVELQKRQQEHRPPLQPLYNRPRSSPRCPRMGEGETTGTQPFHPRGLPKHQKAGIQ
ncbi:uncharacterized protein LOC142071524 [Caretta caretta]|uniref:uncharacterized protein LOC142071524 n=1 Tax=Caretta caretta TaxID=8467 RepID=UPI003F4BCA65